jgi:hypothetical protein
MRKQKHQSSQRKELDAWLAHSKELSANKQEIDVIEAGIEDLSRQVDERREG